jgi:hypothetical protein
MRRYVRPIFLTKKYSPFKTLYDAIGSLLTGAFFNFGAIAFVLLTWKDTIAAWRSISFLPLLITLFVIGLFKFTGLGKTCDSLSKSLGYVDGKTKKAE